MLPYRENNGLFAELAEALTVVTEGAAEIVIASDDQPPPAPWHDAMNRAVVGAPEGIVFPTFLVIVRLLSAWTPEQFHHRNHQRVSGVMAQHLAPRTAWRLVFAHADARGERLLALARVGQVRIGAALLPKNRNQPMESLHALSSIDSLVDDLTKINCDLVEQNFSVKLTQDQRRRFGDALAKRLAELPCRNGDFLDESVFTQIFAMLAGLAHRFNHKFPESSGKTKTSRS